ncbi:MAG TPA: LLM class flavin-dependent oxidoreductase [Chloroflexota bacterium]|nr:LLM class flavin-dependent oxidoreductase [Chloroflexota bacterium]
MRFGVTLNPFLDASTVLEEAQLAEGLGFDAVWIADSQLIWREVYVLLGATAALTSRVLVGTAVTNPVTRHAAVTASSAMTLQELSGGRMRLGIGVGDSSLKTMGLTAAPRSALEGYVTTVRSLCSGQRVPSSSGEMELGFGDDQRPPPIIVAGAGPKMLELAGEMGDGVMLSGAARNDSALASMLRCVETGRKRSTTNTDPFQLIVGCAGSVDPDGHEAKVAVRPHVARGLLTARWDRSARAREVSAQVKASYDYSSHMNPNAPHARLVPDEVVPEFAIGGTPEECIEQIQGLESAGIEELTIYPYAVEGASRSDVITAFARDVLGALR